MHSDGQIVFVVLVIIYGTLPGCDTPLQVDIQNDVTKSAELTDLERNVTQVSDVDRDIAIMRNMPEHTASIIKRLPSDTESVFVCQDSFQLPTEDEFRQAGFLSGLPGSPAAGLLGTLSGGKAYQSIVGKTCNTMVLAGQNFRPSAGIGASLFEGVCFLRFSNPLPEDSWAKLRAESKQQRSVHGFAVVEHRVMLENDELVLSLALPNKSTLVIATDRDYLSAVLANIREESDMPLISLGWEEWKHVDVQAPIWGIRHFVRKKNNKDPTSPFYESRDTSDVAGRKPEAFEWNVPDEDAIGFVFFLREKKESVECVVSYLSQSNIAERIALIAWTTPPPNTIQPIVNRIDSKAIRVTFSDQAINDESSLFGLVLGRLGFATW